MINVIWYHFPRGRFCPSSTIVIVCKHARGNIKQDSWVHHIFRVFKQTNCRSRKYWYIVHFQYVNCCSLEPPPRKTLYVWPPETPTSFMFKIPDLWILQRPSNKYMKIRLDWSHLLKNFWGTQIRDSFLGQWNSCQYDIIISAVFPPQITHSLKKHLFQKN